MYIITGGTGFLGGHIVRQLKKLDAEIFIVRRAYYDLRVEEDARRLFERFKNKKEVCVINLAASVGGIGFNKNHPYRLYYDNLMINTNVIEQARRVMVDKLVQVGTTCSYPKFCSPPFQEVSIWDGYPEQTNAPYGIAKRAALAQIQAAWKEYEFLGIYLIPTNLYGPYDTFLESKSHVIPAMIKKFFDAKDGITDKVTLWGTGKATRDFLYVEDAAKGIILAARDYSNPMEPLNLGSNQQTTIEVLAHHLSKIIDYNGKIEWNSTMPDGQPKRLLDNSRIRYELGWYPTTTLLDGLKKTVDWYGELRGEKNNNVPI